jgi:preprotein translocase subunit YajC
MLYSALLFSDAFAQDATMESTQSTLMSFVPLILVCAIFWFLVLRPQQKRYKEHQAMLNAVTKNDTVVTVGGIIGKVVKVEDDNATLHLSIADNTIVRVVRSAISSKVDGEKQSAQKKSEAKPAKDKKIANDN